MSFLVCHDGVNSAGAYQAQVFAQELIGVEVKAVDVTNSPNWYGLLETDRSGAVRLPQTILIYNEQPVSTFVGVMGVNEARAALGKLGTPRIGGGRRRSGRPERKAARGTLYVIHAEWCGACRRLFSDYWDGFRAELEANQVRCVSYENNEDVDRITELMGGPDRVRAFPTFVVVREDGSVARQFPGYQVNSFVRDVVQSLN